jgi:hypothetical protein
MYLLGDKFTDFPNGLAALGAVPALGLLQIFLSIGWWDLKVWKQVEGSTPGDFGIPYLKQFKTDAQKGVCLSFIIKIDYFIFYFKYLLLFIFTLTIVDEIRAKELNNGRAAMMGILSIFVHEGFGRPYVINDLLGLDYNWNN